MRVTVDGLYKESEAFEKLPGADFITSFAMVKRFGPERLGAQVTGWKRRECPEVI